MFERYIIIPNVVSLPPPLHYYCHYQISLPHIGQCLMITCLMNATLSSSDHFAHIYDHVPNICHFPPPGGTII